MSTRQIEIVITMLSLEATRARFAEGRATIYELAQAVRRAEQAAIKNVATPNF